jgi:hypothetical protein
MKLLINNKLEHVSNRHCNSSWELDFTPANFDLSLSYSLLGLGQIETKIKFTRYISMHIRNIKYFWNLILDSQMTHAGGRMDLRHQLHSAVHFMWRHTSDMQQYMQRKICKFSSFLSLRSVLLWHGMEMSGQHHHRPPYIREKNKRYIFEKVGRAVCPAPRSAHGGFHQEMLYLPSVYLFIHTKFLFHIMWKNSCINKMLAFHYLTSACNLI